MKWLGPMLHLIFPPRQDAIAREFTAILQGRRSAMADLSATRARLERTASRGDAIDTLAGDR